MSHQHHDSIDARTLAGRPDLPVSLNLFTLRPFKNWRGKEFIFACIIFSPIPARKARGLAFPILRSHQVLRPVIDMTTSLFTFPSSPVQLLSHCLFWNNPFAWECVRCLHPFLSFRLLACMAKDNIKLANLKTASPSLSWGAGGGGGGSGIPLPLLDLSKYHVDRQVSFRSKA